MRVDIYWRKDYCRPDFTMAPNVCYQPGSKDVGLASLSFKGVGTSCTAFSDSKCSGYRSKKQQTICENNKLDPA